MAVLGWIIAFSVLIIIIMIALGIGWWNRNHKVPSPDAPTKFTSVTAWGTPTLGPDSTKNTCQLYQFPSSFITIGSTQTVLPGTPTFDSSILDSLQGIPKYPVCLDPDQIMATQFQHECTDPMGVVDGSINRCYLINGGITGLGGTETYYSNISIKDVGGCSTVAACPGQLSVISVNYQAPNPGFPINCIVNNGADNATMAPCDPVAANQLFRITRINAGQNPNNLNPGDGQKGLFSQILDRETGLCLNMGTGTSSTFYNPYAAPGCSGAGNLVTGSNVVMTTCTGGMTRFAPGYVWAFIPSLVYCKNPGGCHGCHGCTGCAQQNPLDNTCSGCVGCTGFQNIITPPQIVYVGNLDISTFPTGTSEYNGLMGSSAIVQWLIDNEAQSLYYGGSDGNLVLAPYALNYLYCPNKGNTSQYINLTLYNTISQESVCFADNTLTSTCIGL